MFHKMRKLTLLLIIITSISYSQSFKSGEFLKYRVHYGFLNAGFAYLKLDSTLYNGEPHYHVYGEGNSTGVVRVFFKVDDIYQTYINAKTFEPSKFIRNINEGGYKKNIHLNFDHNKNVRINDLIEKRVTIVKLNKSVQDMLSAFYYLRTKPRIIYTNGSSHSVNVFMDGEVYPFKLKIEKREKIKTKFGYINAIKIKPYVQSGRVFKAKESVSMWVSDDHNLIPLRLQASLAIGSLKMDIYEFKNTKYELKFD